MEEHYLQALFAPKSIIVFAGNGLTGNGAAAPAPREPKGRAKPAAADAPAPAAAATASHTEGAASAKAEPAVEPWVDDAAQLLAALKAQPFKGELTFLDIGATAGTLADLTKTRADLAIILLPPKDIAAALDIAGRIECRAALIISSGIDATQAAELRALAHKHGIFLLGPNSRGFQRPAAGLNAAVLGPLATPGSLALVMQSGSLAAAMLDGARPHNVGFSSIVTTGPNTALDLADVLDFLASDPATQSIVIYLEGITNARRFMSALRSAVSTKPVVVLKSGRKPAGNAAALTHSGTIVGSDEVFDAALRRAGAVRVRSFVQLYSAAKCLASRYRPVGRRLGVISNGGGPGVLAADWINDMHLELAHLDPAAADAIRPRLAPQATLNDVMDLSEHASAGHYALALDAALKDPGVDGVLVAYSPKPSCSAAALAQVLADARAKTPKPLINCTMGSDDQDEAREILAKASIPSFRNPEAAVGAFSNIATYYQNRQLLQQTPPPLSQLAKPDLEGARLIIESVLSERRSVLTEVESKALLAAFHIPVTQTVLARSANDAMMTATQIGFPVALKIDSPDISHKSEVGGVALNVLNSVAVRDVFNNMMQSVQRQRPEARLNGVTVQRMARHKRGRELYVGVVTDDPFGPVIAFGAGGTMVELMADRAMELPPLNQFLARRLIERARASESLGSWRGASAVDMQALEQVLLRVSEMVCELPQLREMDINPLIADENGVVAVDARIVIHENASSSRPYNHLAILPYPARHEQVWPMRGGGEYTIRPVHPEDAENLQALARGLSAESRYFRFVSSMTELPQSMLSRFTLIDYDREMALVAVIKKPQVQDDGTVIENERVVGVSRYVTNPDSTSCEFSLLVADDMAGKGLGTRLMYAIIDAAREKGLKEIMGLVLTNNTGMLKLMRSLGFSIKPNPDDPDFRLVTLAI